MLSNFQYYAFKLSGIGETFGRVTIEAMAFGIPILCLVEMDMIG
ncbi:hypothetical protein Hdeb2414_s0016g00471501 [Helianthus debilis subsp. tardiflorus]